MTIEEKQKDPCGDGIVLYLNCINATDLAVMLYFFLDVIIGRNWEKGTWDLSVYFS